MQLGRWVAVCLGSGLIGSCILVALLMPETRDRQTHTIRPLVTDETGGSLSDKSRAMLLETVSLARYQFVENTLLGLSLMSLILTTFGKMLPLILDKYAHYRFDLSWEAVGCQAGVPFALLIRV